METEMTMTFRQRRQARRIAALLTIAEHQELVPADIVPGTVEWNKLVKALAKKL